MRFVPPDQILPVEIVGEVLPDLSQEEFAEIAGTQVAELRHILDTELMDNLGASILQPNSSQYLKQDRRGKKTINSQEIFAREAVEKYENAFPQRQENSRRFVPVTHSPVEEDIIKPAKKRKKK